MRRSVIATSVVLSALAITAVTAAETPPQPPAGKPAKRLYTIPEDGLDNVGVMRPNKFLRALFDSRPDELLIVCVAGCYSDRDKVIFAQPMDALAPPLPKPADHISAAPAAPAPDTAEQSQMVPTAAPTEAPAPEAK